MTESHRRTFRIAGLALALFALVSIATAQNAYPESNREVRHIVPWGAGGGTDTAARGFMRYVEEYLGVPIVTENISGGLSSVGLLTVAGAPPDGYTIGTMTYDVLTVEFQGLAPVSWEEFETVCMYTEHPSALIVPADRWDDLAAFRADAQDTSIRVGNVGTGGVWHQHAVAMEQELGIELQHVPYEGGAGPQLSALLGGEVDAIVASLPAARSYIEEGTLRVLGVMSEERNPLVPDAPTFDELGYDLQYGSFRIVIAPPETPADVVATLEQACNDAWHDPEFQAWADEAALGQRYLDSEGTRAYMRALAPRIEQLMTELGLR